MKRKGITFIELMMAVAISTGVLAAVFTFYIMSQKFFHKGAARSQLVLETKNAMNLMTEELSRAEKISELTDELITFTAHAVKEDDIDSFGSEELKEITYIIDRREGELRRIEGADEKILVSASTINVDKEDQTIPMIIAYIKDHDRESYLRYVPEYTDTEKQDRICYIRLRLRATVKEESIDMITGIRLEFIHTGLLQPYWKFR